MPSAVHSSVALINTHGDGDYFRVTIGALHTPIATCSMHVLVRDAAQPLMHVILLPLGIGNGASHAGAKKSAWRARGHGQVLSHTSVLLHSRYPSVIESCVLKNGVWPEGEQLLSLLLL